MFLPLLDDHSVLSISKDAKEKESYLRAMLELARFARSQGAIELKHYDTTESRWKRQMEKLKEIKEEIERRGLNIC